MIFNIPMLEAPRPRGKHAPELCKVCGEVWFPWAGSRLPCHARCLFTERAYREICECQDTTTTLAKRLGVSYSVISGVRRRGLPS